MTRDEIKCIQAGFWVADLFSDDRSAESKFDVPASAERYAKLLRKALKDKFPAAEISVNIGRHGTGYFPYHLQTRVNCLRYHPDCDLVSAIADAVFERFQWLVLKQVEASENSIPDIPEEY